MVQHNDNNKSDNVTCGVNNSPYEKSSEGIKKLGEEYNFWSETLSLQSVHVAYAVIAANWAVHGDMSKILANVWSQWSLIIVFVFLGLNIFSMWLMSHLHYKHCLDAEENLEKWEEEFKGRSSKGNYWPFTKAIDIVGQTMRTIKLVAPILSSALFIVSLL